MTAGQKRTAVFFAGLAVSCFGWWLAGYNFDERSPGVAFGFFVTVMFSLIGAFNPGIEDDK